MTVLPTSGDASPVPWIARIAVTSAGGVGAGVSVSVGGVVDAPPEPVGVGAARVKSAALSSVSTPPVRSVERWSPVPPRPAAGAVSNVFDVP